MALSNLTALPRIAERSNATPGNWNKVYDSADANFASVQSTLNTNFAVPGDGRTVTTLPPYLDNNKVFNVKDYGAVDGADSTTAFQLTATSVTDGGVFLIPATTTATGFILTNAVTFPVGRNVTVVFQGKVSDRITTYWVDNAADLTTAGKGLFAFSGGRPSVIGTGQLAIDGGAGVVGVNQNARRLLYFYNTTGGGVQNLVTTGGLGGSIAMYACSNMTVRDTTHDGGYAMVYFRSCTNCTADNVTAMNGFNSGVTAGNRGFFTAAVLPETRCADIRLINCRVKSIMNGDTGRGVGTVSCVGGAATFTTLQAGNVVNGYVLIVGGVQYTVSAYNAAAGTCTLSGTPTFTASAFYISTLNVASSAGVAMGCDQVDNYTCSNNICDGNGLGTFAFSFADTTNGTIMGNVSLNYNNTHLGTQLPGGIGFECIRVTKSVFQGNYFQNVMCGYQIGDCVDSIFDGVYDNVPASTASYSDSAISSFAQLSSSAGGNNNIRISGVQVGGNYGVIFGPLNTRIYIENMHCRNLYRGFIGQSSGAITYLSVRNWSFVITAAATANVVDLPAGVATDVDIDDFYISAAAITLTYAAFAMGSVAGRYRVSRGRIVNYDYGFDALSLALTELRVRHVDFTNVNTRFRNTASIVNYGAVDISTAGVPLALQGSTAGGVTNLRNLVLANDRSTSDALTLQDTNGSPLNSWVIGIGSGGAADGIGFYNATAAALRAQLTASGLWAPQNTSTASDGQAVSPSYRWSSEQSLGLYRSAVSTFGLSYGALALPVGSATTPSLNYGSSESSLGWYRPGQATVALSRGTLDLAPNAVRLSMRTLAASAITASAVQASVQPNEVVFTIGGASGASLGIMSGGTFYFFNSAGSAKQT